jgi:general secretion pathway protein F
VPLLAAAGIATWLRRAHARAQMAPNAAPGLFGAMLRRAPLLGTLLQRRALVDFFETLGLLIEAGVPMLQALPKALAAISDTELRARFGYVAIRVEQGDRLSEALQSVLFHGREAACALIRSGEASGAIPDTLRRYCEQESAAITLHEDTLADWAPRIVYTLIAIWIARGVLTSGAFAPQVPRDL